MGHANQKSRAYQKEEKDGKTAYNHNDRIYLGRSGVQPGGVAIADELDTGDCAIYMPFDTLIGPVEEVAEGVTMKSTVG